MEVSGLYALRAPEILDDDLSSTIEHLCATEPLKSVLEIGASSGEGSTVALVRGLRKNPNAVRLYCMEVSLARFEALAKRYAEVPFVRAYNLSSVRSSRLLTPQEVADFSGAEEKNVVHFELEDMLDWRRNDVQYVAGTALDVDGILQIKAENGIDDFDLVLIDGSAFAAGAELEDCYGARWLLLDDVRVIKNWANRNRLLKDDHYELYEENLELRNGYSVFRRRD
ncbi:MAG: hypothetical protein U1E22_11155 [Coriobacteriia bacterium]|nr:hypothetical protein [Coriobacteriia bacterium]